MKKRLVYVLAAACLALGGALSGTLLPAGAATNGKTGTSTSNESSAHEKGESAAREKAEDSGQVPGGRDGHDCPNGDGHHGPDGSQGGGSATPTPSTSGSSQQETR